MRQNFFVCPRCRTPLERNTPERVVCPQDGLEFRSVDGVWRFLLPESEAHYARFLANRETSAHTADYYRALPFKDLSGRHPADWRIRARSFDVLTKNVLTRLQVPLGRSLKIVDLGAGNG